MASKQKMEWRNQNENRSFPLKANRIVSSDLMVDAIFYTKETFKLLRIENYEYYLLFQMDNNIYWRYPKTSLLDYTYNNYGKIVVGNTQMFDRFYDGQVLECGLEFEENVFVGADELRLMWLSGDIELKGQLTKRENTIGISAEEFLEFKCDCITTINNQPGDKGHFRLTGDKCTQVIMNPSMATLNDKCLPPCYDCNSRLESGDVHLTMQALEDRVAILETS